MKKIFEQPVIKIHAIVTDKIMLDIGDFKGTWGAVDSGNFDNIIED